MYFQTLSYSRIVKILSETNEYLAGRGIPLEKVLKSVRLYSKFKAYPHQHLDLELLLGTSIESCLKVFGFKEYLQKITGYDFRI